MTSLFSGRGEELPMHGGSRRNNGVSIPTVNKTVSEPHGRFCL